MVNLLRRAEENKKIEWAEMELLAYSMTYIKSVLKMITNKKNVKINV